MLAPVCCPIECGSHGQLMRIYGYTELKPPSVLLAPGAMVAVIRRHPFEAKIICGPRASLGAHWVPQRSGTASAALNKMNGKHMEMDVSLMQDIRTDARFRTIESISMTLNNARLVEVNDTDVREGMRYRSQECVDSIDARIAAGFSVTMVSSALAGDMVYQVRWESSSEVSARARLETMSQLAVELGGGTVRVTETEIRAEGLMWGIRDDAYLASLSIPNVVSEAIEPGHRHIGPEHVATIVNVPDAPVVAPPNSSSHQDAQDVVRERRYSQPLAPLPDGTPIYRRTGGPRIGRDAGGRIVQLAEDAPIGKSLSVSEMADIKAAFLAASRLEHGAESSESPAERDRTRGFRPALAASRRSSRIGRAQAEAGQTAEGIFTVPSPAPKPPPANVQPPAAPAPAPNPVPRDLPPIKEVSEGEQATPGSAEPVAQPVPAPSASGPDTGSLSKNPVAGGEMKTGSIVAAARAEMAELGKVEAPKSGKMPDAEDDPVLEAYRWDRAGPATQPNVSRLGDEPDWLKPAPRPRPKPSHRTPSRRTPPALLRSGSF